MTVRSKWIPRSNRGREIARFLRTKIPGLRAKDVLGHYVAHVPGIDLLSREDLRELAYIGWPSWAAEREYFATIEAECLRKNPAAWGLTPEAAEIEAERAEWEWL